MSDLLPQPAPKRVFLSYARGDEEPFVRRLYADLQQAGFTVWFDRESLMSRGLTFHQEIKDAIRTEVDRVLYIGGPKSALSANVREEWQFALECDHVVVVSILRLGGRDNVPFEVYDLSHSENALRVVAGSADATLQVWDPRNAQQTVVCRDQHFGNTVAISRDGNRGLSVSENSQINVWNCETGELVWGKLQSQDHPRSHGR